MCSVFEIFTKSATTTRHTEMCKRIVREMIELIEKDMEQLNVARDGDEKENKFVANNVSDDVEKTNYSLNNSLPILYPPSVRVKGVINARLKSNMEKRKRKPLKDVTRSSKSLFFYLNFILKKKMLVVWFKYLFVVSNAHDFLSFF